MTAPIEGLLDYEKQAVRDFVDALPGMNLPWRQPSFNNPTFWSKPLVITSAAPIEPNTGWNTVIDLVGRAASVALVNGYTATCFGDAAVDMLAYRFIYNNSLPTFKQLLANVEYNKTGPSIFPVIPRSTFFVVRPIDRLQLQVQNLSASPRYAISALYGWFFDDIDPYAMSAREGLADVR